MVRINYTVDTRKATIVGGNNLLGYNGEHESNHIYFYIDKFIKGIAELKIERNSDKGTLELINVNDSYYTLPVKRSLLTEVGKVKVQLKITTAEGEIYIFEEKELIVNKAIESDTTIPEDYPSWIDIANQKIFEIDDALKQLEEDVKSGKFNGKSAYEEAVDLGFEGTEEEWIKSLHGDDYIITYEDKREICEIVAPWIREDIQPNLDEAKEIAETAESIAKGANQTLSYEDYEEMLLVFNSLPKDKYKVGQNIYIKTLKVPDLWISEIYENSVNQEYFGDDYIINTIANYGTIQVGYYGLSMLETQKVDLTNYVKISDFASTSKAGVVKVSSTNGFTMNTGNLRIYKATETDIDGKTHQYRPIVPANLDYAVQSAIKSDTVKQELSTQGFIKDTDYATSSKAGIIRPANGLFTSGNTGAVLIAKASNAQIDALTDNYYPIVPANLVYAVKVALNSGIATYDEETETLSINTNID